MHTSEEEDNLLIKQTTSVFVEHPLACLGLQKKGIPLYIGIFNRPGPKAGSIQGIEVSACVCVCLSVCVSVPIYFFKASHWPSDHMTRSQTLIG